MLPSGSWIAAIAAQVSAISARDNTPGTSGSRSRGDIVLLSGRWLLDPGLHRVDHQALAEHGVERAVEELRPRGSIGELPHEEVVVAAHRPRQVGALDAHRAAQPPVRRVEGMGMVRPDGCEPRTRQLRLERPLAVDANVAAGGVVVVAVERPADPLGKARG